MSGQNILREYLVALGFKINTTEQKRTDKALTTLDKRITGLAKAAVGAATAITAMAAVWTRQLEKLYYASRYADTTAEKLQEMEFGARQVGLEAGAITRTLKTMAGQIRANPGLVGLLNSLGVGVEGKTKDEVLMGLVKALKGMPFYVAQQYANMFGIDPETLFNLMAGVEEMEKLRKVRKEMAEEVGVDTDKAAAVSKDLMNIWRSVASYADLFGQALILAAEGPIRELAGTTTELLKDWIAIVNNIKRSRDAPNAPGFWQTVGEGLSGVAMGPRVELTDEQKQRIGAPKREIVPVAPARNPLLPDAGGAYNDFQRYQKWRDRSTGNLYGPRVAKDPEAVDAVQSPLGPAAPSQGASASGPAAPGGGPADPEKAKHLEMLEKRYDLPKGLLDRVWKRESNRGDPRFMESPKGAQGHFGFMPATAKEYGLKNPNDFNESSDASARKWRDLLKKFGGDVELAAAAYNWGEGNMSKYGLGKMPKETQDYVRDVAGSNSLAPNVNTTIYVQGNADPEATAKAVAREQKAVGADIVRNMSPKVR